MGATLVVVLHLLAPHQEHIVVVHLPRPRHHLRQAAVLEVKVEAIQAVAAAPTVAVVEGTNVSTKHYYWHFKVRQ